MSNVNYGKIIEKISWTQINKHYLNQVIVIVNDIWIGSKSLNVSEYHCMLFKRGGGGG